MFTIAHRISHITARSPVMRGLLAYGSAEAVSRVVRLASILIVARRISPEMLGTAALALSIFELVRVLANVGIGQRIIAARDDEVEALCNSARQLFWIVCVAVAAIQLVIAEIMASHFGLTEAAMMLAVLSLVYLIMPPGLVSIFLLMREQRMTAAARISATQTMLDNALTVALVLLWPSAWAIILPKLLTAPLWTLMARHAFPWSGDRAAGYAPYRAFAGFGPAILASELFSAARIHADKLIIGALLGTNALGLYYFAFNAGLGITQSFVAACNIVIFPHLCKSSGANRAEEFRKAFWIGLAFLAPVVAAQVLLAPLYVPIVFGATWVSATPYLVMLSLAALPLYAGSLVGARYRAEQRPFAETRMMALATAAALGGLAIGAQIDLIAACLGFALGLALTLIPFAAAHLIPRITIPHIFQKGTI